MLFMGLSMQTLCLPLVLLCDSLCLAEKAFPCLERMKFLLTLPGIDHFRGRGTSSYHHLLGQRHHSPEGDPYFADWMTEDHSRLGNNHEHKHTITGHRGDRIWRIWLRMRKREQNISMFLPHTNKVRWLCLWPSSQVTYWTLEVAKSGTLTDGSKLALSHTLFPLLHRSFHMTGICLLNVFQL